MSTKVYLMRHGEVKNGGEKRYNGHIDIDITDRGVEQMRRLAGLLAGRPVTAVYCSDLIRTVRGAEIIAKSLGIGFTTIRELRERSVGLWEGMTAEEIEHQFPREFLEWRANLLTYRPPKGECLQDVCDRVVPVFRKLVGDHPGREIAVLLHGGVNRVLLADALGLDLQYVFRLDQSFGAFNIIEYFEDGGVVVRLLNG